MSLHPHAALVVFYSESLGPMVSLIWFLIGWDSDVHLKGWFVIG